MSDCLFLVYNKRAEHKRSRRKDQNPSPFPQICRLTEVFRSRFPQMVLFLFIEAKTLQMFHSVQAREALPVYAIQICYRSYLGIVLAFL